MPYYVSSGVTSYGVVLNDDFMYVSSRGTANNTTVGNCAVMYVSRGGVAINTSVTGSGKVYVSGYYSSGEYIPGYYDYVEGGSMFVYSGGTANNTTINDWGNMYVESGGTANGVTVKDGAYLVVGSGGTATNISWIPGLGDVDWEIADYVTFANDISGVFYTRGCEPAGHYSGETPSVSGSGYLVSSGPVLSSIWITTKREGNKRWVDEMEVMHGGTAIDIGVDDDAFLYVHSGGTVVNLSVDPGAFVRIESGAKLTGRITFLFEEEPLSYFNSFFYVWDETTVDFDLTCTRAGAPSLVNYLGFFSDDFGYSSYGDYQDGGSLHYYGNYTLTVAGNQANGTYNLAGAATGFNKTITVVDKNSGAYLGELNVGETAMINGKAYTLILSGSDLAVTIGAAVVDTTAPQISLISGSPTTSTTGSVTVTATFTDNVAVAATYYKLGDSGTWQSYSNSVTVSDNTTVFFKAVDKAGNESGVYSYIVSNIVKPKPAQPTASADITATTRQAVTVTASFGSDSAQRQYSLDGQNWSSYSSGIRFAQNGTVYFRGISPAGTVSDITAYTVSNIDLTAPEVSRISGSPTTTTSGSVTVTATFTDNVAVASTYYKLGENGSWRTCSGSVTVYENAIVSFKAVDRAGNESQVYSYVVNNIETNHSSGLVLDSESRTVSAGETYQDTTVNSGGFMCVSSGGTANSTTVNSRGYLLVFSGGTANGTTVNSEGCFFVFSDGTATAIRENGGYIEIEDGANVTFVSNTFSGLAFLDSATIHSGTTATNTVVDTEGCLYVSSGGTANNTTVNNWGTLRISSGGTANNTTVKPEGRLYVSSGGTAIGVSENGGYVFGWEGAHVTFVSNSISGLVFSDTLATIHSGTTANSSILEEYSTLRIYDGGIANRISVNDYSNLTVSKGGMANQVTINQNGRLNVSSGGTATNIHWTPCIGRVWIADGAYATFVSRYSGVYYGENGKLFSRAATMNSKWIDDEEEMYVLSGGTVNDTTVNSWEANLYVWSGGTANNTTILAGAGYDEDEGYFECGGLKVSSGGMARNTVLQEGGALVVCSGGTANDTTVQDEGVLLVSSGGTAFGVTIRSGHLYVASNGTATDIDWTPGKGLFSFEDGAYVTFASPLSGVYYKPVENAEYSSGTTVNARGIEKGSMYVMSGGILNDATVKDDCHLAVFSGGTANNAVVSSGGVLRVYSGGIASNVVWTPCEGHVSAYDGARMTFADEYSGVYVGINGKLAAHAAAMDFATIVTNYEDYDDYKHYYAVEDASIIGDEMYVMSGGVVNSTLIRGVYYADKENRLFVYSGGTANKTAVRGARMVVYSGGVANDTELKAFLYLDDCSPLTLMVGSLSVSSGGIVNRTTIFDDSKLEIHSGGIANSTLVDDGGLFRISSKGTANGTTVSNGGRMIVSSGGTANNTAVNSGGYLYVSSGGTANNTAVKWNGMVYVSSGGKLTGQTRIGDGANISACSGAILDFDISTLASGAPARIDDMSMISGWTGTGALFTLTVGGSQANGTYSLAGNAAGFNKTISVVNTSGTQLGTLTVGQTTSIGGVDYTLNLNGGSLTVSVSGSSPDPGPVLAPEKLPVFTGDFIGNGKALLAVKDENAIRIYRNRGTVLSELTLADGWDVAGVGDFNGDGADDILRVHSSGLVIGEMSEGDGEFSPQVLNSRSEGWSILGTGDFNGNGKDDVLIANPTGASSTVGLLGYWESGVTWTLINGYSAEWECVATGDFNGDGKCDMLWRNSFVGDGGGTYNAYCTWIVDPPAGQSDWRMVSVSNPDEWVFLCAGDFDGNGSHDIAMINGEGVVGIWGVADGYLNSWSILSAVDPSSWGLAGVGDFNGDGTDDIAWRNTETGLTGYWQINDKALTTWANLATIS